MELHGFHNTVTEAEYLVRQAQEKAMTGDHSAAVNYLKKAIDKISHGMPRHTHFWGIVRIALTSMLMPSHRMTKRFRSIPDMQKHGSTKG